MTPFGEKILYLPAGKRKSGHGDRWLPAIFFGVLERTGESLAGTPDGVFKARSTKRLSERDRIDIEYFKFFL